MANELSITYNGQTKTKDSGVVLNTAGRVMVTNMTITAAADPHTLYTPSSTYFKTGTSGAVSAASIPSNKYASVTYYVKAATPAFDGGALSVSGTANATATNATLSSTNNSGIAITASGSATPSRASVLYNGAVAGWVSKADNAVALNSGTGSAVALTSATYYINSVTVPSGKTFSVKNNGQLNTTQTAGTNYLTMNDGNTYVSGTSGTVTIGNDEDVYGGEVKFYKIDGLTGTYSAGSGNDILNYPLNDSVSNTSVVINDNIVYIENDIDDYQITDNTGQIIIANPAFDGGTFSASGSLAGTPTNAILEDTNNSGVGITISASLSGNRASVLYNGAVHGHVDKADNTVALASASASIPISNITKYVNNITVPANKTLTVSSVSGYLNVNGGATNRGVQVKANKVAVVDGFTVTYGTTSTVNGVTFYAGDLKVPVYNGTTLTYPDPGIFSASAGTTTMSITGNVTTINGLAVKDVNAVTGSGTASTSYSNTYLAKWNTASSLTTGPKVTISSSTPSGGSAGDIWYQTL